MNTIQLAENGEMTMTEFTTQFDKYVCTGDSITCEINGIEYRARIEPDWESHIDDDDCHNTDQSVTGCNDKQFEKLLKARESWLNDEWFYCGIVISAHKAGVTLDRHAVSLWSIEANYPDSDNSHMLDIANDLLSEAIHQAESTLESLRA